MHHCDFMRNVMNMAFLLLFLLLSCSEKQQQCAYSYSLVAHAGGAIDGCLYTNSLEAVKKAADAGYKYIELDLLMTADSFVVAGHSWSDYNSMTGFLQRGDTAPALHDFMSRRIYGKYTPLTAEMINTFFEENSEIFFVTDKISDADVLERFFPNLKSRMVVEAFSYDDYCELKRRGFHRVLYSCMADDINSTVLQRMLMYDVFGGEEIEWIALHTDAFDNVVFRLVHALCDYRLALFTVNDTSAVPEEFMCKVELLYTDSIAP